MKKRAKSYGVPLEKVHIEFLKDPVSTKFAVEVAVEEFEKDDEIEWLLNTMRLVGKAQGGLSKLAQKASVSRRELDETFASNGNPRLKIFKKVIESFGLRISIKQKKKSRVKLARAA